MDPFNTPNWTGRTPRTMNESHGLRRRRPEYRRFRLTRQWRETLLFIALMAASVALVSFVLS